MYRKVVFVYLFIFLHLFIAGLKESDIRAIEDQYGELLRENCHAMLHHWRNIKEKKGTMKRLVKVRKLMKRADVVGDVFIS